MATMYTNTTQNHSRVTQPSQTRRDYPPSPTSPSSNVGFKVPSKTVPDPEEEERKKYLTAKYGQHQMRLIRKRLEVENWVDDELQVIYNSGSYDIEIDLDEVLDLDTDSERRHFIQGKMVNAPQSSVVINRFIEQLLKKASTL